MTHPAWSLGADATVSRKRAEVVHIDGKHAILQAGDEFVVVRGNHRDHETVGRDATLIGAMQKLTDATAPKPKAKPKKRAK
jgi:hypothetical protein